MSTYELIDELEAGELSIEFEGEEPEALLEWAIDRFSPGLAISTSFQIDSVVLIDMAYEIDPTIPVFSVDTGRLPAETFELADRLRARYPGLRLELVEPDADEIDAMTGKHGVDLFKTSVDLRLLCCNLRKVRPLTKHLHSLDAWVTGLRRDQWASRTNIRKVEIDHDHGAIVKLNPLAEWTEDEVWDYVREREVPVPLAVRQGLHLDRLRAVHPGDRRGRGEPRRPLVVGVERAQGVRDPLLGRERRARARAACAHRRTHALNGAVRLSGDAAEVCRAEAQAVLAMVQDEGRRGRLADVVAAVDGGEVDGADADALAELLELGLSTGRVRAIYGPEGEQAALALFRRLPLGKELTQSARDLNQALGALEGRTIDNISVNAVGPGEYGVTISTEDYEVVLRLGRAGARLATIGA